MATAAPVSTVKGSGMAETAGSGSSVISGLGSNLRRWPIGRGDFVHPAHLRLGDRAEPDIAVWWRGALLDFPAAASGLWVIWVQISSFMAGAYLAGRLRRRLTDAHRARGGGAGRVARVCWLGVGRPGRRNGRGLGSQRRGQHGRQRRLHRGTGCRLRSHAVGWRRQSDGLFSRQPVPQRQSARRRENAADSEAQAARILARVRHKAASRPTTRPIWRS